MRKAGTALPRTSVSAGLPYIRGVHVSMNQYEGWRGSHLCTCQRDAVDPFDGVRKIESSTIGPHRKSENRGSGSATAERRKPQPLVIVAGPCRIFPRLQPVSHFGGEWFSRIPLTSSSDRVSCMHWSTSSTILGSLLQTAPDKIVVSSPDVIMAA